MEESFRRGDIKCIGICGFVCSCPGIDNSDYERLGSRIIKGASDMIEGEEHGNLIDAARKYAERYN